MKNNPFFVHKSSYVDDGVTIGPGSKIWHFSHIQSGAIIGKDTTIGQNVNISNNVKIGNNVKIQNNVSIFEGVTLEDGVFCGPSVVFTNVKYPVSNKKIPKNKYMKTIVKKKSTLGANSTILCGISIEKNSLVGAGSVVTKKVRKNSVVVGNPAIEIGKTCSCQNRIFKKPFKDVLKCSICKDVVK